MARTDYGAILSTKIADTSQAIRDVEQTVGVIAPAEWGSRIRAMHSQSDYDNVMAQLVEETTTPASIASFTDGANNLPVKELICTINPTETGSGAKSPSNPYVIGGHTGINVVQTGVNIWDEEYEEGGYDNTTGEKVPSNILYRNVDFIRVKPNTSYYFTVASGNRRVWYYDENKAFISSRNSSIAFAFLTPANCHYINFALSRSAWNDVSINVPATDTTYHAYNGQTHTASFGQTVYGGEFVASEGEYDKVIPWGEVDLGTLSWAFYTYGTISGGYTFGISDLIKIPSQSALPNAVCEGLEPHTEANFNNAPDYTFAVNPYGQVKVHCSGVTTKDELKAALNGIKLYYEPKNESQSTITLSTKTQVRTLLGANNLYHDCNGNTEVTYRANGALYVAQH